MSDTQANWGESYYPFRWNNIWEKQFLCSRSRHIAARPSLRLLSHPIFALQWYFCVIICLRCFPNTMFSDLHTINVFRFDAVESHWRSQSKRCGMKKLLRQFLNFIRPSQKLADQMGRQSGQISQLFYHVSWNYPSVSYTTMCIKKVYTELNFTTLSSKLSNHGRKYWKKSNLLQDPL